MIFKALVIDQNCKWEFIDNSYVKAHQRRAGAINEEPQAIGKIVQVIPQRFTW